MIVPSTEPCGTNCKKTTEQELFIEDTHSVVKAALFFFIPAGAAKVRGGRAPWKVGDCPG